MTILPGTPKARQIYLALITNFSNVGPGIILGYSAVAVPALRPVLNETQLSWFASIAPLAALPGCIITEPIAHKFGKKFVTILINITCFIGSLLIYTSCLMQTSRFGVLLIGRIITGLSMGLASSHATVYMVEVTSPKLSMTFTTWGPIFYSLGIAVVYILGYFFKENWSLVALITCAFPIVNVFFLLFFIPESPSWLYGQKLPDEAKSSICQIYGIDSNDPAVEEQMLLLERKKNSDCDAERNEILSEDRDWTRHFQLGFKDIKLFGIMLVYFSFQQLSGVMVILFCALDFVKIAGITQDPYITICIIGLVRFFTGIGMGWIDNKFGRRPLSVLSGCGMTASMLALLCYSVILNQDVSSRFRDITRNMPMLLVMVYFFTSTLGFLSLPFVLAAEIFPTDTSGIARGALTGFGYFVNFILVLYYQEMIDSMGSSGLFAFYGSMALLGTLFVTCLLPEIRAKKED